MTGDTPNWAASSATLTRPALATISAICSLRSGANTASGVVPGFTATGFDSKR